MRPDLAFKIATTPKLPLRLWKRVHEVVPALLRPLLPFAGILMVAPTPTVRQTPAGIWIPKGFRTKITMSLDPDASMWETEVTPMGVSAGEMIPQDSMWNERWRIKRAQALVDGTDTTVRFLYDPIFRSQIQGLVGVEKSGSSAQVITETDYDGSTRCYYGVLRDVQFDALVPDQPGTGTAILSSTQWDPVNNVEAAPVISTVAGS